MCPSHLHEHLSFHMAHLIVTCPGQMWDYMDAQCDGIKHADELATGQRLQNHCVGENTMMGFQHLCFYFDRIISTLGKKKKAAHLEWHQYLQHASLAAYGVGWLEGSEKSVETAHTDDNDGMRNYG